MFIYIFPNYFTLRVVIYRQSIILQIIFSLSYVLFYEFQEMFPFAFHDSLSAVGSTNVSHILLPVVCDFCSIFISTLRQTGKLTGIWPSLESKHTDLFVIFSFLDICIPCHLQLNACTLNNYILSLTLS
jgi:hypothetical protein